VAGDSLIKVLIADDDPIVRAVLEGLIGRADDLDLVGAANGAAQAADLAGQHHPHVAVLDWVMPGGGGPQAARGIERVSPDTRIVALTSSDTQEASLDMLRAGARSFLVKGGQPREFVETIERAVRL